MVPGTLPSEGGCEHEVLRAQHAWGGRALAAPGRWPAALCSLAPGACDLGEEWSPLVPRPTHAAPGGPLRPTLGLRPVAVPARPSTRWSLGRHYCAPGACLSGAWHFAPSPKPRPPLVPRATSRFAVSLPAASCLLAHASVVPQHGSAGDTVHKHQFESFREKTP